MTYIINPLRWTPHANKGLSKLIVADTVFGGYQVWRARESWVWLSPYCHDIQIAKSQADGKRQATEHYMNRLKSALTEVQS